MKRLSTTLAPLALLCASCASTSLLTVEDRARLDRELVGRTLFLRGSLNVLPFFADTTRLLASPHPEDSVELLETPSGETIVPGAVLRRLDLGTRVRIERIEQPTSLAVTRRPLYTPRTLPWVYFSVVGEPYTKPYIAVLHGGIQTRERFLQAFDALFSTDDPNHAIERYSPEIRTAIREKRLMPGMDGFAVELAWGAPEKIRNTQEGGAQIAVWTWPLGKRSANFRDDRLINAHPPIE